MLRRTFIASPALTAMASLPLGGTMLGGRPAHAQVRELEGSWIATEALRAGLAAPDLVGHELALGDERFQISKAGIVQYGGTYTADPIPNPPWMDFDHQMGDVLGMTWSGIYRLEIDHLILCLNAADPNAVRPSDFVAGPGYVLITYRTFR
jgi:uncharacterized protein (TIGR03067 family)